MTPDTAREINQFLIANNIQYINIMGGEVFCNPQWQEVFSNLIENIPAVRYVTNGDWAINPDEMILFLSNHPQVVTCISKDQWHNNKHVDLADNLLTEAGILHKVATDEQTKEESIVPVGNAQFEYNLYSSMSYYCGKPDRMYSFLIDEVGNISKCSFGAWVYDDIHNFLDGGFDVRFKYFTGLFYQQFIPNCSTCMRCSERSKE
jgi:hypothetical protein